MLSTLLIKWIAMETNTDFVTATVIPSTRPEKKYSGNASTEKCIIAKQIAENTTALNVPYILYSASTSPRKNISSHTAGTSATAIIMSAGDTPLMEVRSETMWSTPVGWNEEDM